MTTGGKRFGSWIVISADATGKRAGCRCACGTVRVIAVEALTSGASTSCGCQRLAPDQSRALRDEAARLRLRRNHDWRPGDRS
jgi:hypothetical protein